jgi:hypothetical protein
LDPPLDPAVPFMDGAAAVVFGFSFFGFFASRLPRCSPFGMSASPSLDPAYSTPSRCENDEGTQAFGAVRAGAKPEGTCGRAC